MAGGPRDVARLTSTRNERVRAAASLARRRERRATGRHLAEGPHAVAEALAAGAVETLFVAADDAGDAVEGLDLHGLLDRHGLAAGDGVEVVAVAGHVLDHLADTRTPQGVVAVVTDPTRELAALPDHGLVVVLDRLADPGNVGAVLRTADAAGASAVVCLRGTSDVLGPKAVRAAAGSTYHLPLIVEVGIEEVAAVARDQGRTLLGLDGRARRSVLDLGADDHPLALVLGSEAHGLHEAVTDHLDGLVAVPMPGSAESLNVAVAAGIAIYGAAPGLGLRRPGSR